MTDGTHTASDIKKEAESSQKRFEIIHFEIWPTACCLKERRTKHELQFGAFKKQTSLSLSFNAPGIVQLA